MADPTLRVLLVDDNKDDFELTRRLLAGARFDRFALDWIADYDQALAAIRARQHDAYLIDQKLKTRSGLDLVREARDNPSPIILFTGQGNEALHLEALLAGAADYVDKNQLDSSGLERVIRHAFDRSRVQLQLKTSEERFRVLVENLSDGILTMAKDGSVL